MGRMMARSRRHELGVVAILCLAWGLVNVELLGVNYLLPFIAPALKLNNRQIGSLVSVYWIAFAVSSYLTGALTDRLGGRKRVLLWTILLFSILSAASALARSFFELLMARLVMGVFEGPIFPLAQSIIALESPGNRRGMNMGLVQNVGNSLLGWFLAPFLVVDLATRYGWRFGFLVVLVPGLICALLVACFLSEPSRTNEPRPSRTAETQSRFGNALTEVLRFRNIWLCAACAIFFLAFVTIGTGFLPLFYINVRHYSSAQMSFLMSALGVSTLVLGILLPAISDRVGRRPVAIGGNFLGIVCPLAVVYYSGPIPLLALMLFVGWAPGGAAALIFGTIPSESVPSRSISTALGLILAIGTLVGGVAGPLVAGWAADQWSLIAPMVLLMGCSLGITILSLALKETVAVRPDGDVAQTGTPV